MSKRPTHDQAFVDALSDPAVPVPAALALFERAHYRSSEMAKGFVLHVAGVIRAERIRRASEPRDSERTPT
jgi:hypothetical protein